MTQTAEGARMELTPPGRDISQQEQDRWFKGAHYGIALHPNDQMNAFRDVVPRRWRNIDPRQPMTHNQACVLKASNAICREQVPWWWGGAFSPIGLSRHSGFRFFWGR